MNGGRILDWRRPGTRLVARLWGRAETAPPTWLRGVAWATAPLNRTVMARRVAARDAPPPAPPLIVSLGNLRVGGTGKTPLALDLIGRLAARGHRGVVVTRGHGSPLRGPLRVAPEEARAGDEARLLAAVSPAWTVIQAADRAAGLARARALAPSVILLEDAHQSAGLPRHLDALILDRWETTADGGRIAPLAGPLLPWGPYREGAEAAARAAIWLVEGTLPPGLAGATAPAGAPRVLAFRREMRLATPPEPGAAWGVISGLARPERFEAACARLLGGAPRLAIRVDDHAPYTPRLAARAVAAGAAAGVTRWVTSAKDAVKLAAVWPDGPSLAVVELTIAWGQSETLPDLVEERLADPAAGATVSRG